MKKILVVLFLILTACSNTSEVAPPIVVPTAAAPVGGAPVSVATTAPGALPPYPPPTQSKVAASYQTFERGFIVNLIDRKQVWVFTRPIVALSTSKDATNFGQWISYADSFKEGDAETDPTFAAHSSFIQPKRSLGKVWRDNANVRTALGWGIDNEQNFTTNITSYPIAVAEGGKFTPKFAFHLITLPDNSIIHLNESTRTWSKP